MKLPFPRRFKAWLVALVSLTAVAVVSIAPMMRPRAQSPPTTYTITDLGTLGGVESKAFATNSCGQVAGYATNASSSERPFFRPSNSLIDLGVLSGDGTATSVNNSGQVVGYSPTNGASNRAFIWHDDNGNNANDPGEMKELLPIGATGNAEDINDNGQVVGWIESDGSGSGTGGFQGFIWENNNFQLISGSPAHASTKVYGINNAGSMVGEDSDLIRGFILRNGTFTDIPAFGGGIKSVAHAVSESDHVVGAAALDNVGDPTMHAIVWTDAGGLKDLGTLTGKTHSIAYNVAIVNGSVQVVGTSYSDLSDARAFVWQDENNNGVSDPGEMKDLTALISPADPDWTLLQQARSINSSGQIVGFGTKNGETHAFLLTPPSGPPSACLPSVNVSVSPASINEDAVGSLTYTFTRSITTGSSLVVSFSTTGTADSSDYGISSVGSVTIPANQQSATVTVDPTPDFAVETNETVVLTTTAGTGYNVGTPTSATGTITNDDSIPGVSVAVSPVTAAEDGATNLVYTFTRSSTAGPLTVNFSVGGTADPSTDYGQTGAASFTPPTGSVTFANGDNTETVTINPTTDATVESDETVILTITTDPNYTVGSPSAATGTITNDDTNVSVAVSPASVAEDGLPNLVYTFTRTGVTTGAITVNFSVGGTATFSSADYAQTGAATFTATSGTVTFTAGASTATVTLNPTTDATVEADETAILTVTSGTGYNVGSPSAATGTITNDDTSVSVAVSPASVAEDGTPNLVYTFTRTGVTTGALTVNFSVDGGTNPAMFSSDYAQTGAATFSATSGTVTFSAGASTAIVTLNPTTDTTVETDETAILTVTSGTGYNVGSPSAATGTITNDDSNVSVSVSPASVDEDGATNLVYTFTRTGLTNAITVNFSLIGSTATLVDSDYTHSGANSFTSSGGTINFASGETVKQITVNPTTDSAVESAETVILTVTTGAGYTVGSPSGATGTITNDDSIPGVSVAVSPLAAAEDGSPNLVYTFTRSSTSGPLTVNFSVGGTADPSTDYGQTGAASFTPPTGSVTFANGSDTATVTVNPTTDATVESDETVILTITTNANYTVGSPSAATGTINNDDTNVSVAVSSPSVAEDGATNLDYTFTRTGVTSSALTVNFSVGGNATFSSDYAQTGTATFSATSGTVTFIAGASTATVTLNPTTDATVEPDETAILTVTSGTGYNVDSPSVATGTITNDDTDVTVTLSPTSVTESGATNLIYTFTRTGVTTGALTVNFSVAATAILDTDYSQTGAATFNSSAGTVTLPAGISFATVTLDPTTDATVESAETVTLTVTSGTGYNVVSPSAATGTITDAPAIYVEAGTENNPIPNALAVDSVTFARGPFRLTNDLNFSSDRLTRIILVTSPLGMTDANLASGILTIHIAEYGQIPLDHIEHVGPITGVPGLSASYIIVKLPADLSTLNLFPGPTNLTLTVKMSSVESNATTLSIIP